MFSQNGNVRSGTPIRPEDGPSVQQASWAARVSGNYSGRIGKGSTKSTPDDCAGRGPLHEKARNDWTVWRGKIPPSSSAQKRGLVGLRGGQPSPLTVKRCSCPSRACVAVSATSGLDSRSDKCGRRHSALRLREAPGLSGSPTDYSLMQVVCQSRTSCGRRAEDRPKLACPSRFALCLASTPLSWRVRKSCKSYKLRFPGNNCRPGTPCSRA